MKVKLQEQKDELLFQIESGFKRSKDANEITVKELHEYIQTVH